jgi:hypothetical protein
VVTFASEWVSTANLPTRSASRILAHLGRCSGIELCERRKLLGVAGPGRRSFGRRLPDTGSYSDARLESIVATEPSPEIPLVIFDAAAFAEVFHDHYGGLVRLAILMCNNPGQPEDAVAEAYARVWPQFREGAVDDVLPYLRRAVVNQVHGGSAAGYLSYGKKVVRPSTGVKASHTSGMSTIASSAPPTATAQCASRAPRARAP